MSWENELLYSLPAACVVFDDRGVIAYANQLFIDLVDAQPDTANFEEYLTVSSRIFYQTHLFPLLAMKGQVSEIFLTLKGREGAHTPVMLNGRREERQDGFRNIIVFMPVWKRQKYEQELIAARQVYQKALEDNQLLNQLAGRLQREQQQLDRRLTELLRRKHEYLQLGKVLMHDMQEPVRKIGYYFASIMEGQVPINEPERKAIMEKIDRSVARLRLLTDSVLRFVSSEDDQEPVEIIHSDELARQAALNFKTVTGRSDFVMQCEGSVSFHGRAKLLGSVFFELISNSVRFKRIEAPLVIKVQSVVVQQNVFQGTQGKYLYADHVQIQVSDNGCGFDQQFATYVFGLFNKLESSTEGIGLGLALCEQIVARHFGKISARSESGAGATFTITLPIDQPVA